jgi:hypothetical protein
VTDESQGIKEGAHTFPFMSSAPVNIHNNQLEVKMYQDIDNSTLMTWLGNNQQAQGGIQPALFSTATAASPPPHTTYNDSYCYY